jgi:hypothetical protein
MNMVNWVDLLRPAENAGVPVMALGMMGRDSSLQEYWTPFAKNVIVFVADSATMVRAGLYQTPTTLFVVDGNVAAEYVGPLLPRQVLELVALAGARAGTRSAKHDGATPRRSLSQTERMR